MDANGKPDIRAKIEELVKKVQGDETLQAQFREDPVKAVEGLLGVKLPADTVEKVVAGVKAKLGADQAGNLLGALGGLLGKKGE